MLMCVLRIKINHRKNVELVGNLIKIKQIVSTFYKAYNELN